MGDSPGTDNASTIRTTKKTDRSVAMFTLQHVLKPFNTTIIKPRKTLPAGSNQLEPLKKARSKCEIIERKVEDIYIYDMRRRKAETIPTVNGEKHEPKRRLYYFGGGAWQMPPSSQHWNFCAEIVHRIPNMEVAMVSYPLAPNSPAPAAFPSLMAMYKRVLKDAEASGEKVIFAGDSAGGNIILCLVLAALAEDKTARCPSALMAICPSADLREINPDMKKIEKHDPILRYPFCLDNANKWRGEWSPDDPRVTPLLADLSVLAKRDVQVHGIIAGYDILSADATLFRDKCDKANVRGEWLVWDKQMHVFPLTWSYGLPEGVEAKEWILDVLRRS